MKIENIYAKICKKKIRKNKEKEKIAVFEATGSWSYFKYKISM
jgi:hypothetical protein